MSAEDNNIEVAPQPKQETQENTTTTTTTTTSTTTEGAPCQDCVQGYLTNETPTGAEETIGGLLCYVATPKSDAQGRCVILLSDVFGYKLPNIRVIADKYAQAGFWAIVPDFFQGDAVTPDAIDVIMYPKASVWERIKQGAWFVASFPSMIALIAKHGEAATMPKLKSVIADLKNAEKKYKVSKIGTIGYCWGGKYSILAGAGETPLVNCFVAAHPSLVKPNSDIDPINVPSLWLLAESDNVFSPADAKVTNQKLNKIKDEKKHDFEWNMYAKTTHGFVVRGGEHDPVVCKARSDAFDASVAFYTKHLQ